MVLYHFVKRRNIKSWQYRSKARTKTKGRNVADPKMGPRTSAQFLPLSTFEPAWTCRKRHAFMRPCHYARDIICDCIAIRQSSARHSVIRICECVEPWSLTTWGCERVGNPKFQPNLAERSGRSFSSTMPRRLIVVMFCGTYVRYLHSLDVKQVSAAL